MERVEVGVPFTFSCNGSDLASVMLHYGMEPDVSSAQSKVVCPFHGDVRPSMVADFSDGTFFCYGCTTGGDAYDFVRNMEPRLSEIQAARKFLRILWFGKQKGKVKKMRFAPKERDPELDKIAHDFYYSLPVTDWSEDDNFTKRYLEYMEKRGFSKETLMKVGAKLTYERQYALVFPMMDNGDFRGWVCRTTLKSVEDKRKYLYNKGFARLTTLVGDYGKKPYVFVVEGYMDRLKFIQHGCDNVVAILGWKMTRPQEEKLKAAGITTIISALDNDDCGRKGTDYLKTRFQNVFRFRYMKGVKDPGDMDYGMFWRMYAKTMEEVSGLNVR